MLDNTAKIGDIITALQDMQGINQKSDLKSALVVKGVNALDTDNVAELINKLNSANLVLDGKRFASGNFNANNGIVTTINNLDFTPGYICCISKDLSTYYASAYIEGTSATKSTQEAVQLKIVGTIQNGFQFSNTIGRVVSVEWIAFKK